MKNKENISELALNLIAYRKSMRLTQNQVATALGIKRSTYAYYERNTMPSLEIIEKLAKIYAVSPSKLVFPNGEDAVGPITISDDSGFKLPKLEFASLKDSEQDFLIKIRMLNELQKEELYEHIDKMLTKEEK